MKSLKVLEMRVVILFLVVLIALRFLVGNHCCSVRKLKAKMRDCYSAAPIAFFLDTISCFHQILHRFFWNTCSCFAIGAYISKGWPIKLTAVRCREPNLYFYCYSSNIIYNSFLKITINLFSSYFTAITVIMNSNNIAKTVHDYRKLAGLSQQTLAKLAGVGKT